MLKNKVKYYKYRKKIIYKFYILLNRKNKINRLNFDNYKIIKLSKKLERLFFIQNGKINNKKITDKILESFLIKFVIKDKLLMLSYVSTII
jgi:hypothetical protein